MGARQWARRHGEGSGSDPRTCCVTLVGAALLTPGDPPLTGEDGIAAPHRFRVARIPEQRVSSVGSEVKTITEAGPSGGELPNSPRPGLPSEQRALLGTGGSHAKWPKPPAENKAEVRTRVGRGLVSTWATSMADKAGVEVHRALGRGCFLGARSPLTALIPHRCLPGEPLCGPAK